MKHIPILNFSSDVASNDLQGERAQQLRNAEERVTALLEKGPVRYEIRQPQVLDWPMAGNAERSTTMRTGRFNAAGLGPGGRRPAAGHRGRTRQRRTVHASARTRDQNPAAAVRAIVRWVFRFTDLIGNGTPSPAQVNLELAN